MWQLLPAEREGVSDIRGWYVSVPLNKVAVLVNRSGQGPRGIGRKEEELRPGNMRQRRHDVTLCECLDDNLDQLSTHVQPERVCGYGAEAYMGVGPSNAERVDADARESVGRERRGLDWNTKLLFLKQDWI